MDDYRVQLEAQGLPQRQIEDLLGDFQQRVNLNRVIVEQARQAAAAAGRQLAGQPGPYDHPAGQHGRRLRTGLCPLTAGQPRLNRPPQGRPPRRHQLG